MAAADRCTGKTVDVGKLRPHIMPAARALLSTLPEHFQAPLGHLTGDCRQETHLDLRKP